MPWTIIVTVYWLAITHTIMSSNSLIRAASVHKWEILFHWITDHAGWLTSLHGAAPIDHDSSVFQTQAVILHLFICHTTSQEKWVMHWFAVYAWLRECKGEREKGPVRGTGYLGLCWNWACGFGWPLRCVGVWGWLEEAVEVGQWRPSSASSDRPSGPSGGAAPWPAARYSRATSVHPPDQQRYTHSYSPSVPCISFFSSNRDIVLNSRGILHDF